MNTLVQLRSNALKKDDWFTANPKIFLNRIFLGKVYIAFVLSLSKEFAKVAKDNMITVLSTAIKNAHKLANFSGVLNVYQKRLNGKASF
jgi:hypothetical protein